MNKRLDNELRASILACSNDLTQELLKEQDKEIDLLLIMVDLQNRMNDTKAQLMLIEPRIKELKLKLGAIK